MCLPESVDDLPSDCQDLVQEVVDDALDTSFTQYLSDIYYAADAIYVCMFLSFIIAYLTRLLTFLALCIFNL